ncbi:alpha/beta hydrolase [Streptomyces sp. NPDC049915]|uniref:alpha/beta fold hydrolase n=1 Tax=Streptomyces sp. NPDC049915 TaxID=3155510 RepID=UPI003432AAEB
MRYLTTPDGTDIAYDDQGPADTPGPPIVLLHGLAGHMGEWDDLIPLLLSDGHRVIRYDARGHGASTRTPADMTRAAAVTDAVALIDRLGLPPVTLIGQSLGGLTALLLAARHPTLVTHLTLIEAGPACANPSLPGDIARWLDSWPAPFPTFSAATSFFGHEAWTRGLERREDGYHPRVDRDTMIAAVRELATENYWSDWSWITCPTLVLRGEKGTMPAEEAKKMQARRPGTRVEVVAGAGHDVHLDAPGAVYEAVYDFVGGRLDMRR